MLWGEEARQSTVDVFFIKITDNYTENEPQICGPSTKLVMAVTVTEGIITKIKHTCFVFKMLRVEVPGRRRGFQYVVPSSRS
jgi:hypothetical protein